MNRIKKLLEARVKALEELKKIQETASTEERAYSDEEQKRFAELEKQINDIDATIAAEERAANITVVDAVKTESQPSQEVLEERAFEDYVMGRTAELRAGEQNITMGSNGAIIPVTIANRIIKKVTDICPVFRGAIRYNVKGTLKVPVWGKANSTHDIAVGYQTEFTEITAASATAVTSDELITLQAQIKQAYQANACWTMNTATFTAIKKLKDSDGKYLLQNDLSEGFP